jgi:hypothetical protein
VNRSGGPIQSVAVHLIALCLVLERDVLASRDLAEHAASVERWARDVWEAWSPHHGQVHDWIERGLGAPDGGN